MIHRSESCSESLLATAAALLQIWKERDLIQDVCLGGWRVLSLVVQKAPSHVVADPGVHKVLGEFSSTPERRRLFHGTAPVMATPPSGVGPQGGTPQQAAAASAKKIAKAILQQCHALHQERAADLQKETDRQNPRTDVHARLLAAAQKSKSSLDSAQRNYTDASAMAKTAMAAVPETSTPVTSGTSDSALRKVAQITQETCKDMMAFIDFILQKDSMYPAIDMLRLAQMGSFGGATREAIARYMSNEGNFPRNSGADGTVKWNVLTSNTKQAADAFQYVFGRAISTQFGVDTGAFLKTVSDTKAKKGESAKEFALRMLIAVESVQQVAEAIAIADHIDNGALLADINSNFLVGQFYAGLLDVIVKQFPQVASLFGNSEFNEFRKLRRTRIPQFIRDAVKSWDLRLNDTKPRVAPGMLMHTDRQDRFDVPNDKSNNKGHDALYGGSTRSDDNQKRNDDNQKSNSECYGFSKTGKCHRGDSCKFAHVARNEDRDTRGRDSSHRTYGDARTDRGDQHRGRGGGRGGRGRGGYGDGSRFAGGRGRGNKSEAEERPPRPCWNFKKSGGCNAGDACRFSHSEASERKQPPKQNGALIDKAADKAAAAERADLAKRLEKQQAAMDEIIRENEKLKEAQAARAKAKRKKEEQSAFLSNVEMCVESKLASLAGRRVQYEPTGGSPSKRPKQLTLIQKHDHQEESGYDSPQ